jgi:ribosomal protein L37E
VRLARAPSSPCPHCGRDSKTVQGVCADCWGPKEAGARQFWIRKEGPRDSLLDDVEDLLGFDPFHPAFLTFVAVAIPALLALLLWISR